ncbi:MAG TPA: hypothetical protein VF543_19195 [Pyrinomonadaceae bacterium]|jgi:hypothetical protein
MKRQLVLIISFALILLFSACSTREDFVVLNQSGTAIEVQYKLKRCTPETSGKYTDANPPAKLHIKEFQESDHEWRNLSKDQYKYDGLTCTFTVNVAANEALLVDYAFNYSGHDSESSELRFDLEALRITGAKGTMLLEGRQAQTQFKNNDSGDYIIAYE